jgi:release factor glutamine methyltransferase
MSRLRRLLADADRVLTAAGVSSPRVDAELLAAHVLAVPRGRLVLIDELSDEQEHTFEELVARRCRREPVQHLTGRAGFRGLDLHVGPGVFTPRPETELLAGWAVEAARAVRASTGSDPVVVDLCTGSGAIAGAVASEVPGAQVHAVELSPQAHDYAERNLAGTGVDLRLGDAATAFEDLDRSVDVVVANPPYIPLSAYETVAEEARRHDPPLALWSGDDGLDVIRVVERAASRLLRGGGVVGCEHADAQGDAVPAVFSGTGRWTAVSDHADLAGRPRWTTARRLDGPALAPWTP